jgi:DNA-binding protein H-NS
MPVNLAEMSLKELKDLQSQVAKAVATFEDRKRQEALSAVEETARAMGFSLTDLVTSAPVRKRKPARAKYANPASPADTWTGRGRKPRWVEAALKSGKKLDDLLI